MMLQTFGGRREIEVHDAWAAPLPGIAPFSFPGVGPEVGRLVAALQQFGAAAPEIGALQQLLADLVQWVAAADGACLEKVDGSDLRCTHVSGILADQIGARVGREDSLAGLAATTGTAQLVPDTSADTHEDAVMCRRLGVGSMLLQPLRTSHDTTVVVRLVTREPNGLGERHAALIHPLMAMAAARLEHVSASQQRTAADQVSATLAEAGRDILVSTDPAQALCEWASRLVDAPFCVLVAPDDAQNLVAVAEAGASIKPLSLPLGTPSIMRTAFETGRLQLVPDFRVHPDASSEVLRLLDDAGLAGPTSGAAVPLVTGGRTVGVLGIVLRDRLTAGGAPLVGLVNMLAAEAGLAIERDRLERRLEQQARTDVLTKLPNRRVWQERLELEMARAERSHEPLCLVILDLDHFKSYNDTHGHQAGDEALSDTAAAWCTQIRETDLLARLGGEEFALLLPGTPPEAATMIAERLLRTIPHGLTASAGLAAWAGEDASVLYRRADTALYAAKAAGRNQLHLATDRASDDQ